MDVRLENDGRRAPSDIAHVGRNGTFRRTFRRRVLLRSRPRPHSHPRCCFCCCFSARPWLPRTVSATSTWLAPSVRPRSPALRTNERAAACSAVLCYSRAARAALSPDASARAGSAPAVRRMVEASEKGAACAKEEAQQDVGRTHRTPCATKKLQECLERTGGDRTKCAQEVEEFRKSCGKP